MKNEIKEILEDIKRHLDYVEATKQASIRDNEMKVMYDYITNLQEKSNNQTEEINRLYKQREKFMKKYDYLKEENKSLKELNVCVGCNNPDYKSRNEKAIEYIRNNAWYCYKDNEENLDRIGIEKILSILGDENE